MATYAADESWGQGRALFGGLVAAWGHVAMAERVGPDRRLRSLTGTFLAPAEPGEAQVDAQVHRVGRAVSVASAVVSQGGTPRARFDGVYGAARPTALPGRTPPRPAAPPPETLPAMPYIPGIIPAFTQRFDLRWAHGAYPYSGGDDARVCGWVRPRAPLFDPGVETAVLMLADAWPCPALSLAGHPFPSSTVTWHIDLCALDEALDGGWWLYDAPLGAAGDGYASFEARLWGPSGRLAALSRQMVAEFSGGR